MLDDLYQEVILDHNKTPRNFRKLETANHRAEGYNPLCGDRLTVYVETDGEVVRDISFEGSGCAISKASASMMTESAKGKTTREVEALIDGFHRLLTGGAGAEAGNGRGAGGAAPDLGKLVVFTGVREFPVRIKCATLPWHTLRAALEDRGETATTE